MPEIVIISWDYREQPDMAEFHRAVRDISEGRVHIRDVELDDTHAQIAYDSWEATL